MITGFSGDEATLNDVFDICPDTTDTTWSHFQAKRFTVTEQRKIAIVGPTPPIRSGIARHTAAVARALADRDDMAVRVWSFSRQYPKFLYPGAAERSDEGAPRRVDKSRRLGGRTEPNGPRRLARSIARARFV